MSLERGKMGLCARSAYGAFAFYLWGLCWGKGRIHGWTGLRPICVLRELETELERECTQGRHLNRRQCGVVAAVALRGLPERVAQRRAAATGTTRSLR